jgi:hypothetical protein
VQTTDHLSIGTSVAFHSICNLKYIRVLQYVFVFYAYKNGIFHNVASLQENVRHFPWIWETEVAPHHVTHNSKELSFPYKYIEGKSPANW